MKNLKKSNKPLTGRRTLTAVLVAVLLLGGTGAAFAASLSNTFDKVEEIIEPEKVTDKEIDMNGCEEAILQDLDNKVFSSPANPKVISDAELKAQEKMRIDELINSVVLEDDFELSINNRSNAKDIFHNTKLIIAERELDENQRKKLESYILDDTQSYSMYYLYDFLFENFFTEDDFDNAIELYNSGEGISSLLQKFCEADDDIVPHDYPEGLIEYLVIEKGVGIEELSVAEIISSRGLTEINNLIDRLSAGERMSNICMELGVLNSKCKLTSISISSEETRNVSSELNLSEADAKKAIVRAKKAKVPDNSIVQYLKTEKSTVNSYGQSLTSFYSQKFGGTVR